jgi:hypothetical protein
MPPSPNDLADHNLVEATREHARWQHPCELVEADGLLALAGARLTHDPKSVRGFGKIMRKPKKRT